MGSDPSIHAASVRAGDLLLASFRCYNAMLRLNDEGKNIYYVRSYLYEVFHRVFLAIFL